MKFAIDIGHNTPPDTGSDGVKESEDKLTMAVGNKLIEKLKAAGHTVINCTPDRADSVNDSLRQRCEKANNENADVFVSIHFNAFNGSANGSEVFAGGSNKSMAIATQVLNQIIKLGFKSRGVKTANYYVIKNTDMPAILVECCFCDSAEDMKRFDAETMAEAIKDGLIGEDTKDTHKEYTLQITQETVLKPSTEQASNLPPDSLLKITPGDYKIAGFSFEEGHYLVEWKGNKPGTRNEDFIFAGHCKVIEK